MYETVCAFLNRHGGTLLLGVNNDGTITGIAPEAIERIRKDFVSAVNNPQKLSPPTYLSIDAVMVGEKHILVIYVPESSQVHRCNGRIDDRVVGKTNRTRFRNQEIKPLLEAGWLEKTIPDKPDQQQAKVPHHRGRQKAVGAMSRQAVAKAGGPALFYDKAIS